MYVRIVSHLSSSCRHNLSEDQHLLLSLSASLFYYSLFPPRPPHTPPLLSSLVPCTVLFPFSFLFTVPCSASMLPWQQSYRKSLLPRPHETRSFHRRWRESGYSVSTPPKVPSPSSPPADYQGSHTCATRNAADHRC